MPRPAEAGRRRPAHAGCMEPRYVWQEVADAIAAEIRQGRPPVGGRLPNERELAAQHGVALNTVRRAVRELRERGLVATLPNKGTFVVSAGEAAEE